MTVKPAIFLDRDGTLNESVGYVNHPNRFHPFPFSVDAVRLIRDEGFYAVLVTNQSGVGRGFYGKELVETLHRDFAEKLAEAGTELDGIYYCPHVPKDDCACRKPRSGMLEQANEDLGIAFESSWIIGDTITDLEAGWSVGTKGALVRTGFGAGTLEHESERWSRQPDLVADNVYRAVCDIVWGPVK